MEQLVNKMKTSTAGSIVVAVAVAVAGAAVGSAGHTLIRRSAHSRPVVQSTNIHPMLTLGLVGIHPIFIEAGFGKERNNEI